MSKKSAVVTLAITTIHGIDYGVGRCSVGIGPSVNDAIAVKAGEEKHVSTEDAVVEWLAARGLTHGEARELIAQGLQAWDAIATSHGR